MDVLVALGTSMAYIFSAVVTVFSLEQHIYFEASAAIITLVLLGKLMEARAKGKTSEAIEALIKLQPKTARIEQDGQIIEVSADTLQVGDVFIVRPGENLPVDGIVVEVERSAGYTFFDKILRVDKDLAFLMSFDIDVELLQDLTASKRLLQDALEKLQYEFFYLEHQDATFELRIMLRTFRSLIGGPGRGR